MSESDTVTGLHSKESRVLSFWFRSDELNLPDVVSVGLNWIGNLNTFCLHIVSTCLNKVKILGPRNLAVVSYGPLFCKYLPRSDLILVTEAFFYEAALISDCFLIFWLFRVFESILWKIILLLRSLTLNTVLALNSGWSLARISNLEHRVLIVYVLCLTGLT